MSKKTPHQLSRRAFGLGTLSAATLTALAACAGGGGAGGSGGTTVAFANKGMNFFFFVVQNEAIKRKSEELDYQYKTTDANQDAGQQFNDWNSLLVSSPAFVIADPIDSKGLETVVKQTAGRDIPVGIVDTPLTKGVADFTIAFDNYRGGEMAAEKTVELLKKRYGREKGTVLNAYGALSSSAWSGRKKGFEDVMKKYPDIEVLSRPTDGDETKAKSVAGATLSEFPTLDAAHSPSDAITRGLVTTLKSEGRTGDPDAKDHVILTSIDGEPQALDWIRAGVLDASVSQDPVAYGEVCVELLHKYSLKGEDIPLEPYENKDYYWEKAPIEKTDQGPTCVIPPFFITADNVDDKRHWANVVTNDWGMQQ